MKYTSVLYIKAPNGEKFFSGYTVKVKNKHKDGECEITGQITSITSRGIYLDVGNKRDAYIRFSDITQITGLMKGGEYYVR